MLTRNKTRGVTLIEWLIVVMIIGIVAFAAMKFNRGGGETGAETAPVEMQSGAEMGMESSELEADAEMEMEASELEADAEMEMEAGKDM